MGPRRPLEGPRGALHLRLRLPLDRVPEGAVRVTQTIGGRTRTVLETADAEAARVAYFVASTAARRGTMTELVDDQGETVDARISDRARSFKAARIGPRQRALF